MKIVSEYITRKIIELTDKFISLVQTDDLIEREDLAQDTFLYTLKLYQNYTGKDYQFISIARKYIPRYLRDSIKKYQYRASQAATILPEKYTLSGKDIRYILFDKEIQVPIYYKYILYLKYYHGYTNSRIAQIVYETPRSITKSLRRARELFKEEYNRY